MSRNIESRNIERNIEPRNGARTKTTTSKPSTPATMDLQKVEDVLQQVESLQKNHELSIAALSEPISSAVDSARTSDASFDAPTPASLEADLAHYKELFAKLRFSFVEQATKEKFIRAVLGDPPIVEANTALSVQNAAAKSALQAAKAEVGTLVKLLEDKGRALAQCCEAIELDTAALRDLPAKFAELEASVAQLRAEAEGDDSRLPPSATVPLAEAKRAQGGELDRQLESTLR